MRLACRHGSSHGAVKHVPRVRHRFPQTRCFSSNEPLLSDGSSDDVPMYTIGSYTPRPQANPQARNIAVLGGGITGLATAYDLTRECPGARITVFEKQDRFGGWIDSELLEANDGNVLFNWGPRSLRPDSRGAGGATLRLLQRLDPTMGLAVTNIVDPPATNRYIYYPDHLVRMPQPDPQHAWIVNLARGLHTIFTEPVFRGLRRAIAEPTVPQRHSDVQDESVGDFITRRFGRPIADNLVSALFHGIYAGDIYKLSARTLLKKLWYLETRDKNGNGIMGELAELNFRGQQLQSYDYARSFNRHIAPDSSHGNQRIWSMLNDLQARVSIYIPSFGISELVEKLLITLRNNPRVRLLKATPVESLAFNTNTHTFTLSHRAAQNSRAETSVDYVVNTLSPTALAETIASSEKLTRHSPTTASASLSATLRKCSPSAVNVMVVNLYYQIPDICPVQGFGYLIPRSVPVDQNPERALGVIFDSQLFLRGEVALQTRDERTEALRQSLAETRQVLEKRLKDDASTESDMTERLHDQLRECETAINFDTELRKNKKTVGHNTASGTKLTVMLGGHWWSNWSDADLPSEDEGIEMAKSVLARHLKITEQPLIAKARLQRDCIPQYQVGYHSDMARIHTGLMHDFQGRLKVAGSWWTGAVGVNDCVRSACEIAAAIREDWSHVTGLEEYGKPSKWLIGDRKTGNHFMDPRSPQ